MHIRLLGLGDDLVFRCKGRKRGAVVDAIGEDDDWDGDDDYSCRSSPYDVNGRSFGDYRFTVPTGKRFRRCLPVLAGDLLGTAPDEDDDDWDEEEGDIGSKEDQSSSGRADEDSEEGDVDRYAPPSIVTDKTPSLTDEAGDELDLSQQAAVRPDHPPREGHYDHRSGELIVIDEVGDYDNNDERKQTKTSGQGEDRSQQVAVGRSTESPQAVKADAATPNVDAKARVCNPNVDTARVDIVKLLSNPQALLAVSRLHGVPPAMLAQLTYQLASQNVLPYPPRGDQMTLQEQANHLLGLIRMHNQQLQQQQQQQKRKQQQQQQQQQQEVSQHPFMGQHPVVAAMAYAALSAPPVWIQPHQYPLQPPIQGNAPNHIRGNRQLKLNLGPRRRRRAKKQP